MILYTKGNKDDVTRAVHGLDIFEIIELRRMKTLNNGLKIKCDSLNEALEKGKKVGYNNALDDFVKFANTMPTVETEDGEIRPMWLEEMAEKLKAGGKE